MATRAAAKRAVADGCRMTSDTVLPRPGSLDAASAGIVTRDSSKLEMTRERVALTSPAIGAYDRLHASRAATPCVAAAP